MSDQKRVKIRYKPRDQFRPFHSRKQRWSVLVCHRRAGKTVATLNDYSIEPRFRDASDTQLLCKRRLRDCPQPALGRNRSCRALLSSPIKPSPNVLEWPVPPASSTYNIRTHQEQYYSAKALSWRSTDRGYLFWPATGYGRRPDGSHGGGGKLIEEMRRASSSQGRVRFDALAPQHYKVVTFFLATMPSQTR
jgi:hypothetical protein